LDAPDDGACHSLLPVAVDDLDVIVTAGMGDDLRESRSEHGDDGRAAGLSGGADGAVEQRLPGEDEELFGAAETGGGSGGEDDGCGALRAHSVVPTAHWVRR